MRIFFAKSKFGALQKSFISTNAVEGWHDPFSTFDLTTIWKFIIFFLDGTRTQQMKIEKIDVGEFNPIKK